jgi:beta-lactamase class A
MILHGVRPCILLLAGLLSYAAANAAQALETAVRERIRDFPGTVSLYAKNLDSGATFGIHETEPVRTASTIKLPIMLAVFDAVARGQARLTDLLTVTAQEKASGSGVIASEISDGVQLPISDVVHLMIVLSDNSATNMLIERFTADAVNAYLDKLGIKTTRLMRKIMGGRGDPKPSAAGKLPENQKYGLGMSTPKDMVAILERLEKGDLDGSKDMLAILKRQQDNTGMRRHMMDLPIANKTGALDALRADVGIVYSKSGRIAMAIYVDGIPKPDWSPDNRGSMIISDVSKLIVENLATPAKE